MWFSHRIVQISTYKRALINLLTVVINPAPPQISQRFLKKDESGFVDGILATVLSSTDITVPITQCLCPIDLNAHVFELSFSI